MLPVLVGAGCLLLGLTFAWLRYSPDAGDDGAVPLLYSQTLPDARDVATPIASLKGRPLVVNFWATWCPPCVEEMPELSALQAELSGAGVQVIGIGVDSASNIRQFASTRDFAYPLLVAGAAGIELSRRLGNGAGGLPFTVVIDANGQVVARMLGRFDLNRLRKAALDAAAAGRR